MTTDLTSIATIGAYHSYVVRVWQESPHAAWRASAQHVQTGETTRFADLDALFAFLYRQTTPNKNSPAGISAVVSSNSRDP